MCSGAFQVTENGRIGTEGVISFNLSGEPSFAYILAPALPAPSSNVLDDGIDFILRRVLDIHAATLYHAAHAPFGIRRQIAQIQHGQCDTHGYY
jgi:hypothetical protein